MTRHPRSLAVGRTRCVVAAAVPLVLMACSHGGPREFDVSPQVTTAPPGVSLAGTWLLNPERSDRPGRYGPGAGRPGGGGMPGYGGRGGRAGGRRPMGGRGGAGARPQGRGRAGAEDSAFAGPPGYLVIEQTDSALIMRPRDGQAYTLYFDGRDVVVRDSTRAVPMLASGHWSHKEFSVRRVLTGGVAVTEDYEVKAHGRQLVVHVRLARGEDEPTAPEIRRVYDRVGD